MLKNTSLVNYLSTNKVCSRCFKEYHLINRTELFEGLPLRVLYVYDEAFKSLLYQFKGLYDYRLKDVFFAYTKEYIANYYKDYIVVCAPSSLSDNLKRGFAPVSTIASTLGLEIFEGIYKKVHYKQSNLTFKERKEVKDKLSIKDGEYLKGKKVLILDDVCTSGNTLKTCITLIKPYHPKTIKCMVLSKVIHQGAKY